MGPRETAAREQADAATTGIVAALVADQEPPAEAIEAVLGLLTDLAVNVARLADHADAQAA